MSDETASPILVDVLDRLEKLTQHIIEVKGEMYRRAEFQVDSARIYDTIGVNLTASLVALKEAILIVDKRLDALEQRAATKDTITALQGEIQTQKSEIVGLKARPFVHPLVLGIFCTGIGGALVWTIQHFLTVVTHSGN
jgi:hypothetical protein